MGTNGMIYIRTDANSHIATGHLIRCLSIAKACLFRKKQVCFVVSDNESLSLLNGFLEDVSFINLSKEEVKNISVHTLQTASYNDLEKELPELLAFLETSGCSSNTVKYNGAVASDARVISDAVFLLDSYYVTESYLSALNPVIKTAYIDDLKLFDYSVNLLINYDIIPGDSLPDYQNAYQNAGQLLLGGAYTPLRPQFENRSISITEKVSDILVTTGGSDPYHFCLRFLETAKELPFTFHVVVGKLNSDKEQLLLLADTNPNVILHGNVSDMASLMEACGLAVSAAGTTLYELCALGIPTVSYTMADNQLISASAFDKENVIPYAGDIRSDYDSVLTNIVNFVTEMSENVLKRKSAHETMHRLVTGNGSAKIADALIIL